MFWSMSPSQSCIAVFFFFLMIRRPPRSTHCISSAASDVYKRQYLFRVMYFVQLACIKLDLCSLILIIISDFDLECYMIIIRNFLSGFYLNSKQYSLNRLFMLPNDIITLEPSLSYFVLVLYVS
eukprot:TRINITY_DN14733_c0_g1_i1.p1 TRINITY_DN14733_c0_g1~~TRINITY_DN14733_c0_g1_i1.p1  ORF type:complete len:124 (+),score=15.47 TRINITY_DN14733_c0_g1_i1:87-458(+)